jgi:hypothetical protein
MDDGTRDEAGERKQVCGISRWRRCSPVEDLDRAVMESALLDQSGKCLGCSEAGTVPSTQDHRSSAPSTSPKPTHDP